MRIYFLNENYFHFMGEIYPYSRLIYPVAEPGGYGIDAMQLLTGMDVVNMVPTLRGLIQDLLIHTKSN